MTATMLSAQMTHHESVTAELTTIEGVEVLRTGTWRSKAGPVEITAERLASIVEASADVLVDQAPLKIGHYDPRFGQDGDPALGWIRNPRVRGDSLVADIVDVPVKLADLAKTAYKRRSAELLFNHTTSTGKTYPAVMTAVSLLGVTPPAVKGMGDLMGIFFAEPTVDSIEVETATTLAGEHGQTADVDHHTKEPHMDEAAIRAKLSLGEDDDILAAVTALVDAKPKGAKLSDPDTLTISKAVYEDLIARIEGLTTKVNAGEIEQVLAEALDSNRIVPAEVETWRARLSEPDRFDEMVVMLGERVAVPKFNTRQRTDSRAGVELSDGLPTDEQIAAFIPSYQPQG